ncbi:helix-turn-helix domain-containing protein [Paenibacillus cucumis (ex Kampfer et al. 2016)]|uniref:Helix-turn-helix domain-containing protein n=1 Tax=Paenibacillus cucumis (ex Kampfer et al. 2016) TaxID=1776858 RepID=A0ABS7KRJ3_9BACL|nr:helix-turn-helix domain-containing protein [Paenibacillus cucumis (ex Kampfer et al. 2016)]MBY0206775.1 helix-turn-helix domain-containing protein [Paenibacillus cucumis (ex Kampfer et al. 2016)]
MNKNLSTIILTIPLCITLIICTLIYVNYGGNSYSTTTNPSRSNSSENQVMNTNEAASYLGISVSSLEKIIKEDDERRASNDYANAYELIPYVTLDENLVFSRSNLDQWINYNSLNKTSKK